MLLSNVVLEMPHLNHRVTGEVVINRILFLRMSLCPGDRCPFLPRDIAACNWRVAALALDDSIMTAPTIMAS